VRVGFLYGSYVKRACTIGWAIVGLMVAVLIVRGTYGVTSLTDPEDAFGFACRHLLFPGALGLLIASVMAANMSTCSVFMVDSGALFTQGFYRRHLRPSRPDGHYLWWVDSADWSLRCWEFFTPCSGRASSLLLSVYRNTRHVHGNQHRRRARLARANRWGAIASLFIALATNFVVYGLLESGSTTGIRMYSSWRSWRAWRDWLP